MTDKEQIEALYREMYEAMIAKDIATLNRIHADDFVLVHMTDMRQSKQEYINAIDGRDYMAQYRHLQQMLGAVGERVWIAKTFNCDRGKNIFIGDDFTGNHNLTILDIREVYIGNHVMIGPNTLITTVGHPLSPKGRRVYHALAKPVRIGNDVWIGGNVTILPGVTIGNNVVVAGAVINKDVPDNTLVGGVPARAIKVIEEDV